MASYIYFYKKISSWAAVCSWLAFITDTDALAIVNTSRNGYLDLLAVGNVSGTAAIRTFVLDDLTGTMTVRAHLYITYHTEHGLLGIDDLSLTITFRTGNW